MEVFNPNKLIHNPLDRHDRIDTQFMHISALLTLNISEMTTFVNYDGVVARIVRPDIECTNGFIHLIDKVVVKVTMTFIENKKIFTSEI